MKPQAFTTTVIGSMPKRRWLFTAATAIDGRRDHFAVAGTWSLSGEMLKLAQDDATRGMLQELQTVSALPQGYEGTSYCADVHVSPSGQFLYGSNRGHDSIVVLRIDGGTGQLAYACHEPTGGKNPRNFAIDPSGTFLFAANQDSDTIVAFRIDQRTGQLTPTGQVTRVSMPVCVKMLAPPS